MEKIQKKPVVILMQKGKLMPTDNVLPLLYQLWFQGLIGQVIFLFSDRLVHRIFSKETLIPEVMKTCGFRSIYPLEGEKFIGRLLRYFRSLWAIRYMLTGPVWFVGANQMPAFFRPMMWINQRLHGGRALEAALQPMDSASLAHLNYVMSTQYGRPGRTVVNTEGVDAVLSSFPAEEFDIIGPTDVPFVQVGKTRHLPAWREMVKSRGRSSFEPDIDDDFFFWPLTVLARKERTGDVVDIGVSTQRICEILADMDYPLQVVFRHHPTTDVEEFERIIKRSGLKRYAISRCHPHELINASKFIFSNVGTSLFCDAWYNGTTVVQYTSHDWMFAEKKNGVPIASIYQPVVDFYCALDECLFRNLMLDLAEGRKSASRDVAERAVRMPVLSPESVEAIIDEISSVPLRRKA